MTNRTNMKNKVLAAVAAATALGGASFTTAAFAAEIRISPAEAIQRALRQNLELEYERQNPGLTRAGENAADSQFDPTLFAGVTGTGSPGTISPSRVGLTPASSKSVQGELGARKSFSTGTTVETRLGTSALMGDSRALNPAYQSGLYVDVRQSLLRGHSIAANEIAVTDARMAREATEARLRRRTDVIAADTLRAYWDLHAALASVKVQKVALENARRVLSETEQLIASGKLAAAEAVVARYQVHVQQRALLGAEQTLGTARDRLARQIGLVSPRSLETPELVTAATPETAPVQETAAELQAKALGKRGDFLALRTESTARKADFDAARHLLLPKLDFVASLGLNALSGTMSSGEQGGLSQSYWGSYAMSNVGWSVGLVFEMPIGNRAAEAKRDVASLESKRADLMVERAAMALSEEINDALRTARTMREQLDVTTAAVEVARTKVENELQRYRAGKTSAQILTQMQSELVREEQNKEQALADYNKALVALRTAAGTLLDNTAA